MHTHCTSAVAYNRRQPRCACPHAASAFSNRHAPSARSQHRRVAMADAEATRAIVLLGAPSTGKSSLLRRFLSDSFSEAYEPTTETVVTFTTRHRGTNVTVKVKDLGGSAFGARDSAGIDGLFLVYSCTSRASLETLVYLHDTVLASCVGDPVALALPRVLVAMKTDVPDEERQVSVTEGKALASRWVCPFVEASAKDGTNIARAFQFMLDEICAVCDREDGATPLSRRTSRSRMPRESGICSRMCAALSAMLGVTSRAANEEDGLTMSSPGDLQRGLLVVQSPPAREYSFGPGMLAAYSPTALLSDGSGVAMETSPYSTHRAMGMASPTSASSRVNNIQMAPLPSAATGTPALSATLAHMDASAAAAHGGPSTPQRAGASSGSAGSSLRGGMGGSAPSGSTPLVGSASSAAGPRSQGGMHVMPALSITDGSASACASQGGYIAVTGADGQQYLLAADSAAALLMHHPMQASMQELVEDAGSTGGTPHTDSVMPMRQAVLSLHAAATAMDMAPRGSAGAWPPRPELHGAGTPTAGGRRPASAGFGAPPPGGPSMARSSSAPWLQPPAGVTATPEYAWAVPGAPSPKPGAGSPTPTSSRPIPSAPSPSRTIGRRVL